MLKLAIRKALADKKHFIHKAIDKMARDFVNNSTVNANLHTEESCDWITPQYILKELGKFDLDPCACVTQPWRTAKRMITKKQDGLKEDWKGKRVFLNPPYGRAVGAWIERMEKGIALIAARVDAQWFHKNVFQRAHSVLFLEGRITFYTPKGKLATITIKKGKNKGKRVVAAAGFPSALVSYSAKDTSILKKAKEKLKGHLVILAKGEKKCLAKCIKKIQPMQIQRKRK